MNSTFGALLGAFGFGTANIVIKKSLSNLSLAQTLFMSTISGVVWLLLFMLASRVGVEFSTFDVFKAFALAMMEVTLYWVFYRTLIASNVTVATALSSTYPLLATLVTVLLFQEVVSFTQWGAIAVLVVGAILTSIDWSAVSKTGFAKKDIVRGWPWILATIGCHALYFPLLGQFTTTGSWETKLLLIKLCSALLLWLVFGLIRRQKLAPPRGKIAFTSLLGLLEVVGWAGYSWATSTSQGQTAILIAILNSAALVTAVWAYFLLGEKLAKVQYVGIGLIVIGLTFLGR